MRPPPAGWGTRAPCRFRLQIVHYDLCSPGSFAICCDPATDHFQFQTETPTLDFTTEFLYLFANVSSLVNAKWFLGESLLKLLMKITITQRSQAFLSMIPQTSDWRSPRPQRRFLATTFLPSRWATSQISTSRMVSCIVQYIPAY